MNINYLPYKQGCLDSLCGVYSLINATSIVVGGLNRTKAHELFGEAIRYLMSCPSSGDCIYDGMGTGTLQRLFKRVFAPKYGLTCSRPFKEQKNKIELDAFWSEVAAFLEGADAGRAVIVGIETSRDSHWTVVRQAQDKRLMLADSCHRAFIPKANSRTMWKGKRKPTRLLVEDTFFISRNHPP